MKENTHYFPHDYFARNDPKISAMINECGIEAYGVYWAIIEILHEQGGKIEKFPKIYSALAYQIKIPEDKMKEYLHKFINDYQLLNENEEKFWNDRVIENIKKRNEKILSRIKAGQIGGVISAKKRKNQANSSNASSCFKQNQAMLDGASSKTKQCLTVLQANQANKIKLNKIKSNNDIYKEQIDEIIDFFNEVTSSHYRKTTEAHRRHIGARLSEGFSVEDCKKVIRLKNEEWKDDKIMCRYITIDTLFGNKFEKYLNQKINLPKKEEKGIRRFLND